MPTAKQISERNIKLHAWMNFLSWVAFLWPVIWALKYSVWLSIPQIVLIYNIWTIVVWLFEIPTSVIADTIWRKISLVSSMICNLIAALVLLIYPSFIWFLIASIFWWLMLAFWSWAGQAFLDENLKICWRQKEFWKVIWDFWFYNKIWWLITPIIASGVLLYSQKLSTWIFWYRVLAFMDLIIALILLIIVMRLIENTDIKEKVDWIDNIIKHNFNTAKKWIINVFNNDKLRFILIYKCLSNSVAYLFIIFTPFVLKLWMPDWYVWIVMTCATIWGMISSKNAFKISKRYWYNFTWVLGSVLQGILLIFAGLILNNWVILIVIYILFEMAEELWYPSWNHIVVEHSQGMAIATTRSIIFWTFALYTTLWKQFLSLFPIEYALIWSWIFLILVNIFLGKKLLSLKTE